MKRILKSLAWLVALTAPLASLAAGPVVAVPLPPPIRPFAGSFALDNGQEIQVQGNVHLNVLLPLPPPIVPPNTIQIRIHSNLSNTRAISATTGQRYVGTGSFWSQGTVIPEQPFSFIAGFRLVPSPPPIQEGQPLPPPILPLNVGFDAVLHLDGSLQVLSSTVLPPVPPGGDS